MRPLRAFVVGVLAVVVLAPVAARGVALRGVVEGYYGRPWSGEARRDVIRFLGAHGMNTFLYAPKNDEFHRGRWRDPYPADALADLAATATTARRAHVRFIYGLSPVLDVCYSCPADVNALVTKLAQVAAAGIHDFALLFDDGGKLATASDQARYGGTDGAALARAQADLVNRVSRRLRARHLGRVRLMVPSEYAGTECEPYHTALAAALAHRLPVGWTGPGVFAEQITATMARARAGCLPGHPVVLWDNYPVNDTVVSNNLHLGPLTGREAGLARALKGYLLNPMTQPHASLVALGTAAAYLRHPRRYDAERAWHATLAELDGGGTGLDVFAAQVRSSALDLDDARDLAVAVDAVAATYDGDSWSAAVDALAAEEARQAVVPDDITARLGGTPLGEEIAPWVRELAAHAGRGTTAVGLLRALKPALTGTSAAPAGALLRLHGRALLPDTTVADELGPAFSAEADRVATAIASPPTGAYLACLGDFLRADIHFCPDYGLNVHGKHLFFLIRTSSSITIVTNRNVYDRLVTLAGRAYDRWRTRRAPGPDALALTVDGTPTPLAPDGTFDVTVPMPAGRATLLLRTASDEATAVTLP